MKELLLEFDLKEEGRREGKQQSILDILGDLGAIPEDLKLKIENTQDISVLQSWVKLAARSVDLEEFMGKMDNIKLQ